jgi:[ribosomal protein S5]-alanine N-acetyltransferase
LKRILEVPSKRRRVEFLAAVKRTRKLHGHWASPLRMAKAFNKSLKRFGSKAHVGYWVRTESGELAGAININETVRGRFRSAYLGDYAFAPHNGRG